MPTVINPWHAWLRLLGMLAVGVLVTGTMLIRSGCILNGAWMNLGESVMVMNHWQCIRDGVLIEWIPTIANSITSHTSMPTSYYTIQKQPNSEPNVQQQPTTTTNMSLTRLCLVSNRFQPLPTCWFKWMLWGCCRAGATLVIR